jgi:rhamnosyltransferase subunit B
LRAPLACGLAAKLRIAGAADQRPASRSILLTTPAFSNAGHLAAVNTPCDDSPTRGAPTLALTERNSAMHVIVSGFGSYGDVLPMVGLGAAMRARGHRVQMITNPYFRSVVEDAGLELVPLGSAEEYLELAAHPDLWHPIRGLQLVLRRGAMKYLRTTYELYEQIYRPGETVIAAHGLDLAARILQDRHGAPMATVHFAPFAILTLHDTPRYIGALPMTGWPRWLKAAQFWMGDRWIVGPIVNEPINSLRGELGLPATRDIFSRWNHSPQLVLAMFPEWYGAPQPDWPPNTHCTGFPLYDAHPAASLPADVDEFLAAGARPIVFAPGSANMDAASFFSTAVEACQRLGRRGMLITKYAHQIPANLPGAAKHFSFVPFSLLLPRVAALVHHGGIGTSAQGLAAGVPQLVMPMAYDQLDNALRLKRLGVGAVVRQPKFKPGPVTRALAGLVDSPTVHERAAHWAARCNGPAALSAACDRLERLAAHASGDGGSKDVGATPSTVV